jgi:predicted transcriptional regulator
MPGFFTATLNVFVSPCSTIASVAISNRRERVLNDFRENYEEFSRAQILGLSNNQHLNSAFGGNVLMAEKKIRDIMTKNIMTVSRSDPVQKAVQQMASHNISCVIVTEKNHPVGIVTERDLVKRILGQKKNPAKVKASQIMTGNLITVSADASLYEAMELIEGMHIRRLPVVDRTGIVGLVTLSDIVRETQTIHQHNQRLMFHQNLQSYIILIILAFFVIVFIFRFYFA